MIIDVDMYEAIDQESWISRLSVVEMCLSRDLIMMKTSDLRRWGWCIVVTHADWLVVELCLWFEDGPNGNNRVLVVCRRRLVRLVTRWVSLLTLELKTRWVWSRMRWARSTTAYMKTRKSLTMIKAMLPLLTTTWGLHVYEHPLCPLDELCLFGGEVWLKCRSLPGCGQGIWRMPCPVMMKCQLDLNDCADG